MIGGGRISAVATVCGESAARRSGRFALGGATRGQGAIDNEVIRCLGRRRLGRRAGDSGGAAGCIAAARLVG